MGLYFGPETREWAFKKFCCVHFTANQGPQEVVYSARNWKISPKFREIETKLVKITIRVRRSRILFQSLSEVVAETALRASWFWPSSAGFPGTWGIFSSPGASKLTPDGLGLQWNAQSKTFLTITLQPLGRNIAPLQFKTEKIVKTALQASWFWPTSARFPGTWRIFSSPGDFKLTPDGLCFQLNAQSVTF